MKKCTGEVKSEQLMFGLTGYFDGQTKLACLI